MWKRITSGILSIVLLLCMLPMIPPNMHTHGAYYPQGWKEWQQGYDPRWSYISIGSSTVGYVGCWLCSFVKMYIQAGLIDDSETDFDVAKYVNWVKAKGGIGPAGDFTSYDLCLSYPNGEKQFNYLAKIECSSMSKQQLVEEFTKLRNEGKMIHVRQAWHHTICVGDPFINENGEPDVELYDTAKTVPNPSVLTLPEYICFYEVYERADGKPAYPGTSVETSKTEKDLDNTGEEENTGSGPLYRLSRYNEKQKESLALLMNKKMNAYELSAMKWNMIVSQFTIPYLENINDTLTSDGWSDIYKAINTVNWEANPYLVSDTVNVDDNVLDATQEYISYLQDNSSKLNEVLKLLANKDENVYTKLYSSDKTTVATVRDLLNDDVLYVRDNITLTGDAVKTKKPDESKDKDNIEIVNDNDTTDNDSEDTGADIETILKENVVKLSSGSNNIITEPLNLWDGLTSMYDISTQDAKTAYKSILEKSAVQTVNVPVFVATDSTALYNALFINNAMEFSEEHYSDLDTSAFIGEFENSPIYMDRWGNICTQTTSNKYVIVYPSYANPMFVSTELDNSDLAGVYYEALGNQLSKYSLTIKNKSDKLEVLMSDDENVQITVEDAIKHINNYNPASNDTYVFGEADTFRINYGLNNEGGNTKTKSYNRLQEDMNISNSNPPFYRFDTTTLAFANKTMLTMMSRDADINAEKCWYTDLVSPTYKIDTEEVLLENIIDGKSSAGKLSVERFGVHVGLNTGSASASNMLISNDKKLYSLYNGDSIAILSRWRKSSNVVSESFKKDTKTLDNMKPFLYYLSSNSSDDAEYKTAEYPFMIYLNGLKDIYDTEYNNENLRPRDNLSVDKLRSGGFISSTYLYDSVYNIPSDKSYRKVSMYENLFALEYLDSERFNIYFTTNSHMGVSKRLGKPSRYNRAPYGTYVEAITKNDLAKGVYKSEIEFDNHYTRLLSVPILSTTIDDTTSWGLWSGDDTKIGRDRTVDNNKIVNKGYLIPTPQDTIEFTYEKSGLKYLVSNEIISSTLHHYPIEDIISIAYIWDSYYIPNSPIGMKLDTKPVNQDGTLYDVDTIITPYNGIHEDNNNTLFWTRETNSSISMTLYNKIGNKPQSIFNAYRDIYEVQYNVPMFLLAVNKNADNDNLARWIGNLEDPASTSAYVMDLISAFIDNPISGFRNLILGISQVIHGAISKGSLGNIFNIETLSNIVWGNDGLNVFIVVYCAIISISLLVTAFKYMVAHIHKGLPKKLLRVAVLGIVPVLLVYYVGNVFALVTNYSMSPLVDKIVLTELEGSKRAQSKVQFGSDGEVLMDTLVYSQESFEELTVNILGNIDDMGNKTYVEVSLADLYKSVSYDEWSGNPEYIYDTNGYKGFEDNSCALWYNTEEFMPVHYAKYKESVFYYFYDWIKSNYIMYQSSLNCSDFVGYSRPDKETTDTTYVETIGSAEKSFMVLAGGVYSMLSDERFIKTNDEYSDIFGLSNLFKMTNKDGLSVYSYTNDLDIKSWSDIEYNKTVDYLSDYSVVVDKDNISGDISPISAIIQSPYWEQYSINKNIHINKNSNLMNSYSFTPDYIQHNFDKNNIRDFSDDWVLSSDDYVVDDNSRIPWRVYASRGLLENNTDKESLTSEDFSLLENDLFTLNSKIYADIASLCRIYEQSNISDDTMIFVSALIATFDFNKCFDGDFVSLNLDTLSSDKMFRVVYASEIEDVIDNPNLVYMIYNTGGLFASVLFVLTEILFVGSMYLRCILYCLLIIACAVVCLSDCILKETKFKSIMMGLLIQLGVLLLSQTVLLALVRVGMSILSETDSKGVVITTTLVFAIVCFALIAWHIILFKSLIKSFRDFGFAVFNDEVFGFKSLVSKASMGIKRFGMQDFSGRGVREKEYTGDNEKRNKKYVKKVRLNNLKKLDKWEDDNDP